MMEYRFGQSIDRGDLGARLPAESSSVYYAVFRVKGDRLLTHASVDSKTTRLLPAGIHFGIGSGLRQQHSRILKEEANKFVGRHSVEVNWVDPNGAVLAVEDRQVTLKELRPLMGNSRCG